MFLLAMKGFVLEDAGVAGPRGGGVGCTAPDAAGG